MKPGYFQRKLVTVSILIKMDPICTQSSDINTNNNYEQCIAKKNPAQHDLSGSVNDLSSHTCNFRRD